MGSFGAAAALADVRFTPFWLDRPAPEPASALVGSADTDLAVVGGGYTGLWTALIAKERDPSRDVLLLEARTSGWAASGRNGGFCSASLTHGLRNGLDRYPAELPALHRHGMENLDEIEAAVAAYDLDCSFERTGELTVATADWQAGGLRELATLGSDFGVDLDWLDADAVRERVDSPTYVGGLLDRRGTAMLDPARLVEGLRAACLRAGVRIHEQSPVTGMEVHGSQVGLRTPYGRVNARRVALGTGAARPLLRRLDHYIAPVWDYALVSEPLSPEQRESIGWKDRVGVSDAGNQFHYYRLTDDDRILWGGYDAVYRFGGGRDERFARDPETFLRLSEHFFATFPQLDGLRFTHAWGGVIDTCSRFSAFWGTAMGGRVAYALGYTGLGVGATRFGAQVVLDLLAGEQTERTSLRMVRSKPLPFPPEPVRWAGIQLTRGALARADRRGGRRGPWLRTLDRLGLGFDS
jgi:glycine/D-amino acid oxidase-like deaminating enzyme